MVLLQPRLELLDLLCSFVVSIGLADEDLVEAIQVQQEILNGFRISVVLKSFLFENLEQEGSLCHFCLSINFIWVIRCLQNIFLCVILNLGPSRMEY